MKKRLIALLLALVMAVGLVSCKEKPVEKTEEELLIEAENNANLASGLWEYIASTFPNYVIFKDSLGRYTFEKVNKDLALDSFDWTNLGDAIKGIDVSAYQGNIDWGKVSKQNVKYAIVRAGYRGYSTGALTLDSKFDANMSGALKNDIAVGAYFVTKAISKEEAVEEAKYLISLVKPYNVTWPLVIDIEPTSNSDDRTSSLTAEERTSYVLEFCNTIKDAGYTPMIYGGVGTFMKYLEFDKLEGIDKWFAQYFNQPWLRYEFGIWQKTDTGSIDGIKGNVDIDYAIKDYSQN